MTLPAQNARLGLGDALRGEDLLGFAGRTAGRPSAKAAFVGTVTIPQSQINGFAASVSVPAGGGTNGGSATSIEPSVTVTDAGYSSGAHETYTVSYSGFISGDLLSASTAPGGGGGPNCAGIGAFNSSGLYASNDPSQYSGGNTPPTPVTTADVTTFFESFTFSNSSSSNNNNGHTTTLHDVTVTFADTNSPSGHSLPPASQTVTIHVAPSGNALTVAANDVTIVEAAQTYTGKTQISGEVDIGGGGSIASSQQVALKASGAIFDVSGASAGGATVTIQELSGVAGSSINLGAGVLSLNQTVAATYAGTIAEGGVASGTGGGLVVNGSAPLTLSGTDTYTGKTQIYGQLDLAGGAVLNTSKAVTLKSANAVFDISGATGKEAILNLAGVAGSHIYLGGNTLKINDSTTATFSGVIADGGAVGGTGGGLIVKGSASLALTGNNTFTGGVTLQTGTLELTTPTAAGVGHALTFTGQATLQLDAGALSGSGTSHSYDTPITGLAANDAIQLTSLAYASDAAAVLSGSTLTVTSGGSQVTLSLPSMADGSTFTAANSGGHVVVALVGAS